MTHLTHHQRPRSLWQGFFQKRKKKNQLLNLINVIIMISQVLFVLRTGCFTVMMKFSGMHASSVSKEPSLYKVAWESQVNTKKSTSTIQSSRIPSLLQLKPMPLCRNGCNCHLVLFSSHKYQELPLPQTSHTPIDTQRPWCGSAP